VEFYEPFAAKKKPPQRGDFCLGILEATQRVEGRVEESFKVYDGEKKLDANFRVANLLMLGRSSRLTTRGGGLRARERN
jgi:hypothetical protein